MPPVLLDPWTLYCSLCICAAAQSEASPWESGVISPSWDCWSGVPAVCGARMLWQSLSWCCVTLGSCSVLGGFATTWWATWRELAKPDFFRTEKKKQLWRMKPSGRSTPGLLSVCKMRACQGAFRLVRRCRLRWKKLTVGLNRRTSVSRLCDAACQPCHYRKDAWPARLHQATVSK